jgi:hypothetical protein
MKTLLLSQDLWDLVVDVAGNIAVATDPYAIAQDVASSCRVFKGEVWYDTARGVPYFPSILGQAPPASFIKAQLAKAAALIQGCNNPVVVLTGLMNRQLSGQVQFTDIAGRQQVANF